MNIGLISDTHSLVRPQALAALAGSDHILHAGDLVTPDILPVLEAIAPVTAVRGNNDRGPWARRLAERETFELGWVWLHMLHDLADLDLDPAAAKVAVIVSGHSHQPLIREDRGVLYVNPGSAGPRRFRLPVTVARLTVEHAKVHADIIPLDV